MPTKRAILSELTADELRANVEYYELEVHDRRVKTETRPPPWPDPGRRGSTRSCLTSRGTA